jgi:hypothetical protein
MKDKKMGIIYQKEESFKIRNFKLEKSKFAWRHMYNYDLLPFANEAINLLNSEKPEGLYLLYGKTGCGKTSFIKRLTSHLNRKIICLPPDFVNHLSSQNFINFAKENLNNTIIVIDDAETILKERKGGKNAGISKFLNEATRILVEYLKLPIICIFNKTICRTDKALTRKGKLITSFEFKFLLRTNATGLSTLVGHNRLYLSSVSLAEVFNPKKQKSADWIIKKLGIDYI